MYRQLQLLRVVGHEEFLNTKEIGILIGFANGLFVLTSFYSMRMFKSFTNSFSSIGLGVSVVGFAGLFPHFMATFGELFHSSQRYSERFLQSFKDNAFRCSRYDKKMFRSYGPLSFGAGGCMELNKRTIADFINIFTLNALITLLLTYR